MEALKRQAYETPTALLWSTRPEQVLCTSTGTEAFEEGGGYDWGN